MADFDLQISNETFCVNGKEIKKVFGGFGDNQPCIFAKQVAEIHGYAPFKINELINNNLDFFEEGTDYIDLKSLHNKDLLAILSKDSQKIYTRDAINASSNIYLLSQQGYILLCKFMRSEEAKRIYKEVVREYFSLKDKERKDLRVTNEVYYNRLINNKSQVNLGCFSIIDELAHVLFNSFSLAGVYIRQYSYTDEKELRPDISVGRLFKKYLTEKYGTDIDCTTYNHILPNGIIVPALQYNNKYASDFKIFVIEIWLPEYGPNYFSTRDIDALRAIPRLLKDNKNIKQITNDVNRFLNKRLTAN